MAKRTGGITLRCPDTVSSILLAAMAPVATWTLVGDLSSDDGGGEGLDHFVRAPRFGPVADRLLGIGSVALIAGAVAWLAWSTLRRHLDRRWWSVLLPISAADVIIGAGARVVTAGVVGANIGSGLVIVVGSPLTAGLVTYSVHRARRLLR